MDFFNEKAASIEPSDIKFVEFAREKYKNFSTKMFRIIFFGYDDAHYYVVFMIFNATDQEDDFFQYIKVYDSRYFVCRDGRIIQKANPKVTSLLHKFQNFVANYILYDHDNQEVVNNQNSIMRDVTYHTCPRPIIDCQFDCSLFGLGVVLHLVRVINITQTMFTQNEITYFRKSLYLIFNATEDEVGTNPRKWISTEFINSFFPFLFSTSNEVNLFLDYLHQFHPNYQSPKRFIKKSNRKYDSDDYDSDDYDDADTVLPNIREVSDIEVAPSRQMIMPKEDDIFKEIFIDINIGNQQYVYRDLEEVTEKISLYELESKIKLRIQKSVNAIGSRLYTCVSHEGCNFRASFGPRRGNKDLILKKCHLVHSGYDRGGKYDNGKLFKQNITHLVGPVVSKVELVKTGKPTGNDVVKATKNLEGQDCKYPQAHKVIAKKIAIDRYDSKLSYQLLVPYLEQFQKINTGTYACYMKNKDNEIVRMFICPGIMNNKLRYVRPVVSLDASHLTSELQGTLYVAAIKSGNNEVLPIAIGMTIANENFSGWKYFLEALKKACPMLTAKHPMEKCNPFNWFTYISDRDKGLLPALKEVFPMNHSTNCLFHIRQNVKTRWGLKAANITFKIGPTFSIREEDKLFAQLNKVNQKAFEYVQRIDPKTWRSTEWIRNTKLPPRYGITTSNNAETCNSMFKHARAHNWDKKAQHNTLGYLIPLTMIQEQQKAKSGEK